LTLSKREMQIFEAPLGAKVFQRYFYFVCFNNGIISVKKYLQMLGASGRGLYFAEKKTRSQRWVYFLIFNFSVKNGNFSPSLSLFVKNSPPPPPTHTHGANVESQTLCATFLLYTVSKGKIFL